DDRVVYGYHETGSVNGINNLLEFQGITSTGFTTGISSSRSYFLMGNEVTSDAALGSAYSSFLPPANPTAVISYSDVSARQAFSVASPGSNVFNNAPTTAGYGSGEAVDFRNFTPYAGSTANFQALTEVGQLDDATDNVAGGVDTLNNRVRNESLAVVPFTVSANPGTGLGEIGEKDLQMLNLRGRLANGADFNYVTRDIGSGTRNQAGNNVNVDPSWAAGERDRVQLAGSLTTTDRNGTAVTILPGNEARPGRNLLGGSADESDNEHRPSALATFADKTSGSSALRPTVLNNRMALGVLSTGDVGSRGMAGTDTPLRVLAIDFEGTDYNLDTDGDGIDDLADTGAVELNATTITSGQYQLWSSAQAVTVVPVDSAGNPIVSADRPIQGDVDDQTQADFNGVAQDATNPAGVGIARKVLDNTINSIALVDTSEGVPTLSPVQGLIEESFVPLQLMAVSKTEDGGVQTAITRSTNSQNTWDEQVGDPNGDLAQALDFATPGSFNGNVANQTYKIADAENTSSGRSPVGTVEIQFTDRNFLAGDLNNDGVRDLEDAEAWASAIADVDTFLADQLTAGDDIGAGSGLIATNNGGIGFGTLDVSELSTDARASMVALTDLNGDGNVVVLDTSGIEQPKFLADGSVNPDFAPALGGANDKVVAVSKADVEFFLFGASVDTSAFTTAADRRQIGVIAGQLRKNEAVDRYNAKLTDLGASAGLRVDRYDVDGINGTNIADLQAIERNVGKNYTDIADVLSTGDDLIRAEMNDDNVITHIDNAGFIGANTVDAEGLAAAGAAAGDFAAYRATLGAASDTRVFVSGLINAGVTTPGDIDFNGATTVTDAIDALNNRGIAAGTAVYTDGDTDFNGTVTVTDAIDILNARTTPSLVLADFPDGSDNGDNGDNDMNQAVTLSAVGLVALTAAESLDAQLVYDPADGNVAIELAAGDAISAFSLQNMTPGADDGFVEENFLIDEVPGSFIPEVAVTAIDNELAVLITNSDLELTGLTDLGDVFPTGLDLLGLEALLSRANFNGSIAGAPVTDFDFALTVVPEPASLGLLGVAGLGLMRRRRSA
ncbi:MAG: PEP-CTERM sorting domain-containing protein, partial [Planctomycetota bacterium]